MAVTKLSKSLLRPNYIIGW